MSLDTNLIAAAKAGRPYASTRKVTTRGTYVIDLPQAGGMAIADAIILDRVSGCDRIVGVGVIGDLAAANTLLPFLRPVGGTQTNGSSTGAFPLSEALVLGAALSSDYAPSLKAALDVNTTYELCVELNATIAADAANNSLEVHADFVIN